jgi:DNA-binding beta-propeller fold protein YncE
MKKNFAALAVPLFFSIGMTAGPVLADGHGERLFIDRDVDTFAVLPNGVSLPEGITANPVNGDIYVSTFTAPSKLLRYNRHGRLLAQRDFAAPLLGLEFDRVHNKVYITNVGDFVGTGSRIQRVAADLSQLENVAEIRSVGAPAPRQVINPDDDPKGSRSIDTITFGDNARVPNAMVFDGNGNLYISDSFQGAVFKITNPSGCVPNCTMDPLVHDPLLATAGFPPFGANGLAFNSNESVLFVANTGDDRVLKIRNPKSATPTVTVFAESLNGADGLVFDERTGLLWVCANQADEVVALNNKGRIVAKLGEFRGINRNGTPDGLLFPASAVIVDDEIFVTNLAVALTEAIGDEPEEDVKLWTISRMKLPRGRD